MPAPMKPMIDWQRIKRMHVEEGVNPFQIERIMREEGTPVSRQGICKRARKEGWLRPDCARSPLPPPKPAKPPEPVARSKPLPSPAPVSKPAPNPVELETDEQKRAAFLEAAKAGFSVKWAARYAEVEAQTAKAWLKDVAFERDYHKAVADGLFKLVKDVRDAADRGDSRAAMLLLERHHEAREDFAPASRSGEGAQIQIVLNIDRKTPEPITIDAQAVPAVIDMRPCEKAIEHGQ